MRATKDSKLFVAALIIATFFCLVLLVGGYIVSDDWATAIDDYCYRVDQQTSAEIVVCVFPSLTGHGITNKQSNEITDINRLQHTFLTSTP